MGAIRHLPMLQLNRDAPSKMEKMHRIMCKSLAIGETFLSLCVAARLAPALVEKYLVKDDPYLPFILKQALLGTQQCEK
jgi:hypothetical protein